MKKVLIVEDNQDDRELLRSVLADLPDVASPVIEAVNEATCTEALNDHQVIDCILLDYSLPGRDGLEVLASIMERDPTSAVVMITGQGDEAIAVKAMKAGARDYLTKDSISAANLQRAISNATERSRMQRKLLDYKENLQSFAHLLVHDLRAPLRSLRLAIDILHEDLPQDVAAENADMLEAVAELAHRMDALILALKTYTEVDGKIPSFEPVDLNVSLANVRANLSTVLSEKDAVVTSEESLPSIPGSAPLIEQMLQNLIGNGIKYNRSPTPHIRISSELEDDKLQISVSDNGIGIEQKFLRRIFEPFKRLHVDSEYEGTGLGLATCKKIAERHGGTLSCQSEPGAGSVFTFTVPKQSA